MSYLRPKKQIAAPTTGATIVVDNASVDIRLVINAAGTIATLTITMPSVPFDGQKVDICSSNIVTLLTMNGGTINGALSSLPTVNSFVSYIYESTGTKWYKCS